MKAIGVLALQGDFQKHLEKLDSIGVDAKPFKEAGDIPGLAGLVIPGGESTTIGMLMERRGLIEPLRQAIRHGLPVFGTCAGAILLAEDIQSSSQTRLGLMDISVIRNAYGTQLDSFEARLGLRDDDFGFSAEVEGVFIRAPVIRSVGKGVRVLGEFNGNAIMARQGNMLVATFHPELTKDTGVHGFFARYLCGIIPRKA